MNMACWVLGKVWVGMTIGGGGACVYPPRPKPACVFAPTAAM